MPVQGQKKQQKKEEDEEENDSTEVKLIMKKKESFKEENKLVKDLFDLIFNNILQHDKDTFKYISNYSNLPTLLTNSLIKTENFFHRGQIGQKIKNLIIQIDQDKENIKIISLMLFDLT